MIDTGVSRVEWLARRFSIQAKDDYVQKKHLFIDHDKIINLLGQKQEPDRGYINKILAKSLEIKALSLEETATLLQVKDPDIWAQMQNVAQSIKRKVYDNRIVTFAPLYLGNRCVNNCHYCGFRSANQIVNRRVLTMNEIKRETEVLAGDIGHKRLIVVYGEHQSSDIEYMAESIQKIYSVKTSVGRSYGSIRRVNVNAAPLPVNELTILRDAGLGTYQVFQETYHQETYRQLHPPETLKADYKWRLYSMHRAFEAGIDDVGIGALFGLYDWRYEVMGLVTHALELESQFGIGPHTISFPRLRDAFGNSQTEISKYAVSDDDFFRLITVLRLAVPYTGMILTAREPWNIRKKALSLGCTQTDASSNIAIGGYGSSSLEQNIEKQQFKLGDNQSLDMLICELAKMGYITSFCTAGYRCGRTGKKIMNLLCSGKEAVYCKLNAILTFTEWLEDFAGENTLYHGRKILEQELREVEKKMNGLYTPLLQYYNRIKNGERDLFF